MELWISIGLTTGLAIACTVVLIGGALMLAQAGARPAEVRMYRAQPEEMRSIGGIVRGALRLDARAITLLGAVLLIATPVARVALALLLFARQRDRLYVFISAIVLGLLLLSLLMGV